MVLPEPPAPVAHPVAESTKKTDQSTPRPLAGCEIQLVPPLVVFRMTPLPPWPPTAQPVLASRKRTYVILRLPVCVVQLTPPFVVLRIVAPSPTIQPVSAF